MTDIHPSDWVRVKGRPGIGQVILFGPVKDMDFKAYAVTFTFDVYACAPYDVEKSFWPYPDASHGPMSVELFTADELILVAQGERELPDPYRGTDTSEKRRKKDAKPIDSNGITP